MKEEQYTHSILTFAFTNDGKMIVRKDKDGKIDTLPQIFMGYREFGSKIDYEDSIWVMKNIDDYKERIAIFFAYHLRNASSSISNGFFVGNENGLLDCGELHKSIEKYQIFEMRTLSIPSYIRVNRELYDSGINMGHKIINRIETRYVVLPQNENIENYPRLEAIEFNKLKEDLGLLSDRVILGITGNDGEIMESFISQLKSIDKSAVSKKY